MTFGKRNGTGEGRRHRHRFCQKQVCPGKDEQNVVSLSEAPQNAICLVVCNPIKKTKEIGINPGKEIKVFKNEPSDGNMIITLETTRYIIAKSLADNILVTIKASS